MANDVLDLDALKPSPIRVKVGGKELRITRPSIGQMLDVCKMEPALKKAKNQVQIAELMIEQLAIMVNAEDTAMLRSLTFEQLEALREHISSRLGLSPKKADAPRRPKK